ncbi:juvenile hormone esterase-like [Anticarsia gemmatalis]|uniref:juvenile hormone esterase-like n=1 Tax=Anticarsia gemmatalis TaxID=129554 RepID=UPI003F760B9C
MYALIFVSVLFCVRAETVSVVTEQGTVVGQKHDGYDTFFGIPFAKVDEENPFGNTIEYPPFETPFNANDSSIICPQAIFTVGGILQCLRLNIYVPHTTNSSDKLPVFVWFHGGGFAFGSSGEYGGQHLVKKDIIVVTANYRLGPYGFFCLNEPSVPGNQGMKDQIDALRWVNENIVAFGGDPEQVTIAGESYGGGAVDLHLYSEYETLFDKAIVQSGSIFDEGFYVKPDRQAAVKIAKFLGHNVTNTKDALKLLARAEPTSVVAAAFNLTLPMTVCKEKKFKGVKNFVTHDPFHLRKLDRVENTKIMLGYTSMELLYVYANQPQEFYDKEGDLIYKGLQKNFNLKKRELEFLSGMLKKFYLGKKNIGPGAVIELSESSSDFVVNHAMERSINKYLRTNATVYKYVFSYIGGSPYKNISGSGASHTEELKYLFEWETPLVGDEQMMVRNQVTELWANFVKFGNPTPEGSGLGVTWTPVTGSSRPYLNIDVDLTMGDHIYHQRMAFWDLFWHKYEKSSVVYDP